jgi:hypothetical protein
MKILIIIILNIFSQTIFAEPLKDYELNKILWCYNEKLKLLSPNEKFNFALKSLLEQNWYHLFIDKERLEKHEKEKSGAPHLIFDIKEPGYYQAMFQTFKSLGSSIGLPITLSLIIKLHDQAVDQVYSNKEQLMSKGISSNPFNFGWIQKPSQKALEELSTSAVLYDDKTVIEIMPSLIPAIDPESNAWVVPKKYLHLYLEKENFLAKTDME